MIREAIGKVIEGRDLTEDEMVEVFEEIMTGNATQAQIGSFITALRMKGEKVAEISGAVRVMREKAQRIKTDSKVIVDTCGTGGDGAGTFNISTTAAFVTAGAGMTVAKHGNRSVSSKCGSADLLKALGVNIEADLPTVEKCLREAGICFLFAPLMHGAMKHAIGPRREIGVRTIFNILGPLTNPAVAKAQVIGVYDSGFTELLAQVLGGLGSTHVFVVHGSDGLDEITLTGCTRVSELRDGKVQTYDISPIDFDMECCSSDDLKGGDAELNASITIDILKGEKGPKRDIVLLNSAAAITAGGKARDLKEGISIAIQSIDSGEALKRLEKLKSIAG